MAIDRRTAMAGLLGAAGSLAAGLAGAARAAAPGETRRMPSDGQAVPAVGLGTWITFNVGSDPALLARSTEVMRAFFAEGGGVIDSSPMYGSSQATVGHGLRALGYPESLIAADKVWTGTPGEGPSQVARSRGHWGVARFDLLQVHNLLAWEAHLERLLARRAAGELRYVGVTTSHGRRHRELEAILAGQPVDAVQLTLNALDREAEARLLPLAREKGIAVVVNRPFRRGALVARMRGAALPGLASEIGAASWAQLLLAWVLSHPAVTVAIPATTNPAHVRENKAAAQLPLLDEAMRRAVAEAVRAA